MINEINYSILGYPSTSDYDEADNSLSISTVLELTIKNLMKETSLVLRAEQNLVRRGQNIGFRNIPNGKSFPESNERSLKI